MKVYRFKMAAILLIDKTKQKYFPEDVFQRNIAKQQIINRNTYITETKVLNFYSEGILQAKQYFTACQNMPFMLISWKTTCQLNYFSPQETQSQKCDQKTKQKQKQTNKQKNKKKPKKNNNDGKIVRESSQICAKLGLSPYGPLPFHLHTNFKYNVWSDPRQHPIR